ncbi:hypothetical protein LIR05_08020, partial [[Ruminococcus] lactaris]|uniref:hypothetical protein n=1 Tax=[Ruminococcus] lactaris TaxID=46228 RepID=UPI001D04D347
MTGAKTEYLKGDESDQTEIARYRIILIIYEKIPNQTKNGRKSDDGDKTARNEKSRIIKKYNKIPSLTVGKIKMATNPVNMG